MSKVALKNIPLARYVMMKLNKFDNEFSQAELAQVTEVVIDSQNDDRLLCDLPLFHNIKNLMIKNAYISDKILRELVDIESVYFDKCQFENSAAFASLKAKDLSFIDCDVLNYDFIDQLSNLEKLTITNGEISIERLNLLKKLTYLDIAGSRLLSKNNVLELYDLSELYIYNTNIQKLDFLKVYKKLELLAIDQRQYENNLSMVTCFKTNNVTLLNEGIVGFGDDYE